MCIVLIHPYRLRYLSKHIVTCYALVIAVRCSQICEQFELIDCENGVKKSVEEFMLHDANKGYVEKMTII